MFQVFAYLMVGQLSMGPGYPDGNLVIFISHAKQILEL
jgi:hypothetical protein